MKIGRQIREVPVLIPGRYSSVRGALYSSALSGGAYALQLIETIRRLDAGEEVGLQYIEELNRFAKKAYRHAHA